MECHHMMANKLKYEGQANHIVKNCAWWLALFQSPIYEDCSIGATMIIDIYIRK